ncbi:MAG TPA: hypothetical protein VIL84_14530 [Devosiaceae bacterium]
MVFAVIFNVILFVHLFSLVLGMGSGIAMSNIGPLMGQSNADQRSTLFRLGDILARNGHVGLGLLWVTGIVLVAMRWSDLGTLSAWFWVKIALVVVLSASIGMGSRAYRGIKAGDMASAALARRAGMVNAICGPAIIFCAVMAFN